MTKQELLTYIDQNIYTNGNQEITAAMLNPVLQQIVEWTDTEFGDLTALDTDSKTVVGAINELNQKIGERNDILTGDRDPNVVPPASFSITDYYNQVNTEGVTVALWQYNGIEWVLIN